MFWGVAKGLKGVRDAGNVAYADRGLFTAALLKQFVTVEE
jgi:hypothetical protein